MSKTANDDSAGESRPELKALYERVTQWRAEIGVTTRPDMGRLREALHSIQKTGLDHQFVLFVVTLCEWSFRVRSPLPIHIRRALKFKFYHEGYSPFGPALFQTPVKSRNVPPVIDAYVDACLQRLWNQEASEQSRILLRDRMDSLVRDFTKPFLAAGLTPLKPKRGGYPWQAPWVACTIVYELLRPRHPRKRESVAIDAALDLAAALIGRLPDQSYFHRKRREVLSMRNDFPKWFVDRYKNFTVAWKLTVPQLLEPQFDISPFTVVW
jgi:hypothetical protein